MEIILTHWALDSYLTLRQEHIFSREEFWDRIRPDVLLLKDGYPSPHEKFTQPKFWGKAAYNGMTIQNAYKMKWHNIGRGKVQLRLCVIILKRKIYLCNSYVKDDKSELIPFAENNV